MIQEENQKEIKIQNVGEQNASQTSSKMNEQSNVYYTKNKRILFWLYLLVGVIFVTVQVALISLSWKNMQQFSNSDNFYLANQVSYEWKQGYVIDILVTSSVNCPAGYENAVNYTWPGTSFGCYCQVDSNSSFVLQGYCSASLIQSSCRNILSKDAITATLWQNLSNICLKRSSVSFATQQRYNGNNKVCGSSKSLTIVPSTQNCPLVNATFSVPTLEDHYRQLSDIGHLLPNLYGTYNATSPYSFYSYPINKFTVSQYQFCLIDQDLGITPGHTQFILLNLKRGCATTGDYQTLSTISEITFYANNAKLNALSSIDGFPKPGNWDYKLGFSSTPGWTYNCRHNYDKKFSIPKALNIINFQFFKSYYYISLVQIIFLSVVGFQIFILAVRRLLKRQVYPVGYRQMYLIKDFVYALSRYIIDFVAKAVILSLLIYTSYVTFVNWNWFKSALNLECPDGNQMVITLVMEPFRNMYQTGVFYAIGQLVVFAVVGCIDLWHFFYIYRNDLTYYLVNSYGKVIVQHQVKDDLDWMNKENQKKLMSIQNVKDGDNVDDNASDKFRVTMAMNVFQNQKIGDQPVRPKVVKKKKKKFGVFKKQYQNQEGLNQNNIGGSDQFNPFSLEDPSIIGLNSIDNLSGQRKQQNDKIQDDYVRGGKKLNRRKKK